MTSKNIITEGDVWRDTLRRVVHNGGNVFDNFTASFDDHYASLNPMSIAGLKEKAAGNYQKGIGFEELVVELLSIGELLSDWQPAIVLRYDRLTDEQKTELGFVKGDKVVNMDMGIDIVAKDIRGWWYAIQVKYVKKPRQVSFHRPWQVDHELLNTFRGYTYATGPVNTIPESGHSRWKSHVVITNAMGVKHIVNRTVQDRTVARGTFCSIALSSWKTILGDVGNVLVESSNMNIVEMNSLASNEIVSNSSTYFLEKPAYVTSAFATVGSNDPATSVKIPKSRKTNLKTLRAARNGLLNRLTGEETTVVSIEPKTRRVRKPRKPSKMGSVSSTNISEEIGTILPKHDEQSLIVIDACIDHEKINTNHIDVAVINQKLCEIHPSVVNLRIARNRLLDNLTICTTSTSKTM